MAKVLYLTHNGITDHIGQSQIAPYCLGLAALGHEIQIVSAEKPGRDALKADYAKAFANAGIRWSFVTYHNRPPILSQLFDVIRMRRLALRIAEKLRPEIVHCRSYLPIPLGVAVKRRVGAKLLIDFRHFWVEAGLADSPFKFIYRAVKKREPKYFAAADHVDILTARAAGILNGWYPSAQGIDRFTVIPCCADFDHFDLGNVPSEDSKALRQRLGIGEKDFVLLYLGSIGPDYLLADMMRLFAELLNLRPDAKFLFVSNNGEQLVESQRCKLGIPSDAVRFITAARDEIPTYLSITDLSVLFYRPDLSRAGCSPTKLAELLAANVPVIANSNVGDLDTILGIDRNCSTVVSDFRPETLRRALLQVLSVKPSERSKIREKSREFSLEEGVRRYDRIYRKLAGEPAGAKTERVTVNA